MTDPHEIRECGPEDAEALARVGAATFLETFAGVLDGRDILAHCASGHAPELYRDWLAQDRTKLWLAAAHPGGAPIGYLVLAPAKLPVADLAATDLEVKRIYLLHRFHGAGLGKRLLAKAVDHARSLGARRLLLGVYAHNSSAIAFYRRNGFTQIGVRTFQVGGTGYDDRIMSLSLDG